MEPFRQSMRPRSGVAGAENILRIGRGELPQANPVVRDAELSRKGQAAPGLVSQGAAPISADAEKVRGVAEARLQRMKRDAAPNDRVGRAARGVTGPPETVQFPSGFWVCEM